MPTFAALLMSALDRLKPAMKFLVAAAIVLTTFGIWAVKTWQGQPVNPLVVVLALVLTAAAARVVFGPGTLSKAIDTLGDAAETARGIRQQRAQERFDRLSEDAPSEDDES